MAVYKTTVVTDIGAAGTNTIITPTIVLVEETYRLVSGKITDGSSAPVVGASVVLYKNSTITGVTTSTQVAIAYTDAAGEYGISYLPATPITDETITYSVKVFTTNTL